MTTQPAQNPSPTCGHDWKRLDPDAYFEFNYAEAHPCDLRLAELLDEAWRDLRLQGNVIELGCGANLYPILYALPWALSMSITDINARNLAYMQRQREAIDPRWGQFVSRPIEDHQSLLRGARIAYQDLYALPFNVYDVVSMNFVAESVTDSADNLRLAMEVIADSLRYGGTLLASFMLGFTGSEYAGVEFPAVPFTFEEIQGFIEPEFVIERVEELPQGDRPQRDTYTGMGFVRARAR